MLTVFLRMGEYWKKRFSWEKACDAAEVRLGPLRRVISIFYWLLAWGSLEMSYTSFVWALPMTWAPASLTILYPETILPSVTTTSTLSILFFFTKFSLGWANNTVRRKDKIKYIRNTRFPYVMENRLRFTCHSVCHKFCCDCFLTWQVKSKVR